MKSSINKFVVMGILMTTLTSCYTNKAIVGSSKAIHSGALSIQPQWKKKLGPFFWIMPATFAAAGYGTGKLTVNNGIIAQGITPQQQPTYYGILGGVFGASLMARMIKAGYMNNKVYGVTASDYQKWVNKYNRSQARNYVIMQNSSYSGLTIIPKRNLEEFQVQEEVYVFQRVLAEGDRHLNSNRFEQARVAYKRVQYHGIDDQQVNNKITYSYQKEYDHYLDQGDRAIQGGRFDQARGYFTKANNMNHISNRELAQDKYEASFRQEYQYYMDQGQKANNREDYVTAKSWFRKAQNLNFSGDNGQAEQAIARADNREENTLRHVSNFFAEGALDGKVFTSLILGMDGYTGRNRSDNENFTSQITIFIETSQATDIYYEIIPTEDTYMQATSRRRRQLKKGPNRFIPDIPWKPGALKNCIGEKQLKLRIILSDDNGQISEKIETITLMGINSCLLRIGDLTTKELLAAYVDENHREIEHIKREALAKGYVPAFTSYQSGPDFVDQQVAAIFRVLHDRGIDYSNKIREIREENIFYQEIRTVGQSLASNQANCIDGTVLMASVLMDIGIRPIIVTVPGHAFLAYHKYRESEGLNFKSCGFLETTKVSQSLADPGKTEANMSRIDLDKNYKLLFKSAQLKAQAALLENLGAPQTDRYDITELRRIINPIGS